MPPKCSQDVPKMASSPSKTDTKSPQDGFQNDPTCRQDGPNGAQLLKRPSRPRFGTLHASILDFPGLVFRPSRFKVWFFLGANWARRVGCPCSNNADEFCFNIVGSLLMQFLYIRIWLQMGYGFSIFLGRFRINMFSKNN